MEVATMSERQLLRSTGDRMFLGVAAGLAEYFNIDPVLVRLLFVLLTMTTGYGLIIYIVLAIVMPEKKTVGKVQPFDEDEIVINESS
jgi:phage shock protein C